MHTIISVTLFRGNCIYKTILNNNSVHQRLDSKIAGDKTDRVILNYLILKLKIVGPIAPKVSKYYLVTHTLYVCVLTHVTNVVMVPEVFGF
jgi:hypothetical protein